LGIDPAILGRVKLRNRHPSGDGQFASPAGVAVNSAGEVYVTDYQNHRVQRFTSSGTFLNAWGSQGAADGQFSFPADVAVDPAGDVYVTEFGNSRVQKFDAGGTFLFKWGTDGSGNGQFFGPWGVVMDGSANVFIADPGNQRIQRFGPNTAPTLDQPSDMTVTAGATADQTLNAIDPDGDPITFSLASGPTFATVTTISAGTGTATGNLNLAPGASDTGTSSAAIPAGDGTGSDSRNLTISVLQNVPDPTLSYFVPQSG